MGEENEIFDCIAKNNNDLLKIKLAAFKGNIDFTDDNGKSLKYSVNNSFFDNFRNN